MDDRLQRAPVPQDAAPGWTQTRLRLRAYLAAFGFDEAMGAELTEEALRRAQAADPRNPGAALPLLQQMLEQREAARESPSLPPTVRGGMQPEHVTRRPATVLVRGLLQPLAGLAQRSQAEH